MSPAEPLAEPAAEKITIAPDQPPAPFPSHLAGPNAIGLFEWQPLANGTYKPTVRLFPKLTRMKATITDDLALGITYASLRRLMEAGFVRYVQAAPGNYAFDLQSYFQHCAAVKADPKFWTGKNLKRYAAAIEESRPRASK